MPMKLFDPKLWSLDPIPYYLNFWLFKTNHVVGQGVWEANQKVVSSVIMRIVVSGSWDLTLCGVSHKAARGDVFCCFPSENFFFRQGDPGVRFEWRELCFSGPMAERFMGEFGLSKERPVVSPRDVRGAMGCFKRIESLVSSKDRSVPEMLVLLSALIKACNRSEPKPELSQGSHRELVARAMELMEADPSCSGNIKQLAEGLGVERSTLYRAFKGQLGISVHDYVDRMRKARASELLGYSDMSVAEVAARLGFANGKYFMTWFKSMTGLSPGVWRKVNRGRLT